MNVRRRILAVLGALGLCVASLAVGYGVRYVAPGLGTAAVCAQEDGADVRVAQAVASAQMAKVRDTVQGRVLIGEQVVITTLFTNNDMDPYERASLAAARINMAVESGAGADDFQVFEVDGTWYVLGGDRMIISVAEMEATASGVSAESLAASWVSAIATALHQVLGTEARAESVQPAEQAETVEPEEPTAAAEPAGPPSVEHQEDTRDGRQVGLLLIDGQEVLQVLTTAGGYAPPVRARMLATRLSRQIEAGLLPSEVIAGSLYGLQVVQAREQLLISIEKAEADSHGRSPSVLAGEWARAISGALAAHYAPPEPQQQLAAGGTGAGTDAEAGTADVDRVDYTDKWVPILSVLDGTRIGMARIAGPSDRVGLVQAVAQVEARWQKFIELNVYVPISTRVPGSTLDRVQGVGVTGLADLKL